MSYITWIIGLWSKYSSQITAIFAAIILAIQTIVHIINPPPPPQVVHITQPIVYTGGMAPFPNPTPDGN